MTVNEKLAQVLEVIRNPIKDSVNPHFNSGFASLNECMAVVNEAVRKVGDCAWRQESRYNPEAGCYEIRTIFFVGEDELVLASFPYQNDSNPQKAASASTYARRYSLVIAFNLAAEDDDGNKASQKEDIGAAKRRMWEAIKRWSELHGREPNDVLEGQKKRPDWDDTAEFFEGVAIEFESDINV